MKKVALSTIVAVIISGVASADALTLYNDAKTGQVFTTPGEGRVEMGEFISVKEVDMQLPNLKSKAKILEFSGTHYFGLSSNNYGGKNWNGGDASSGFELRRNYLQAKAYFNDKDYFRVTMDATKELESTTSYANIYVKYAYLYLDTVLPYTGVEIGIAHRPWIDYEEHNAWNYRSINKVALEDKFSTAATGGLTTTTAVGPDVLNSADLGINFKTKTPYISSELGLFNGEGYHADKAANNQQNSSGLSFEWRLTGHLLGNGEQVGKYKLDKDTYANISFAGLHSKNHKDNVITVNDVAEYDRNAYWFHFVYNQPEFLLAAQYGLSKDKVQDKSTETKLNIWSINGEIRPAKDWTVLARYDSLKTEYSNNITKNDTNVGDATQFIYGTAYRYNKNIKFIASGKTVNSKDDTIARVNGVNQSYKVGNQLDKQSWMLTTEVTW
ncbi:MAG: hypothetical protein RBR59_05645 [Sulfurimonadaceae bacterium]|jgi:hypothetical protein|nr:hypothetical protein [Sulfurimonadaceae bacterium]